MHYVKCVFLSSLWESGELASFSPLAFNILKASKLEMNGLKSLSGRCFSISKIIKLISQFCCILQANLKYMHICSKAVSLSPHPTKSHFMIQYVCFTKNNNVCFQNFGRYKCFLWDCSDKCFQVFSFLSIGGSTPWWKTVKMFATCFDCFIR